ncbi:MAG: UDP-N-acetylglucosamine 2-epimerase (non-hydrolyzing) [Aquamicrobium sp.]|jgi:UDP-GlcNAc3NAcA epimerase|uniref:non-hydrolyzing UDP-N-acetylglucosamine 2-epimerase n=1 Tax=Mesorhizobium sp. Pch-S TaxID=2082387 RepID=UPI001010C43A|nr:UDP-N-acetylglucosamine 2-epimerase (non-hydrolyzing) [Mesorhizobium sp. Pch-S]MBR2687873.1 UDP-N-acetylglucosamine 2-epimerase (non-hydrolyzing) [Aquamicrobium sp.]QAZ41785.1 UDP-N-acetylglucosamine 2-epimerase (non-hydrolyzing) [Mesorhizobium sp. Pch-S]
MKTIATIVGARPQFIKVAPVSKALAATGSVKEVLIHTGQHFDASMSDVFFEELGIAKPDHHLGVNGGGHGAMTGAMLQQLEPVLQQLRPDRVLIYGDTNSTLAGALVASKLHIPVAHVEAGLRSFNRAMPEEINRIVADQLSDILFASTDTAVRNLEKEGFSSDRIFSVGDVMYDAALQFAERAAARRDILDSIGVEPGRYVLATVHRAENTDDPQRLRVIVSNLERVAEDLPVVLPIHPRTAGRLKVEGLAFSRVTTIPPVGYLHMVALESQAAAIATDSGGVQKEAFFYRVPCVTLRDETEWRETVDLGWNRLASPSTGGIAQAVASAIGSRGTEASPYGDGRSAVAIAKIVAEPS